MTVGASPAGRPGLVLVVLPALVRVEQLTAFCARSTIARWAREVPLDLGMREPLAAVLVL